MGIASLAIKSFRNRKFATGLSITAITLSVALLLGVEILRGEARTSFTSTVSGTDLIVGARTSSTHLLLYSVFGIGNPSSNISWSSYRELSAHPQVAWSIPISMGDNYREYRVVGTDRNFFEHYRYARQRNLSMREGRWFETAGQTTIGAEVADGLGLGTGQEIVVAHGAGEVSFIEHSDDPFRISGILNRTGTPVDRTVFISLEGFDGMHDEPRFGGVSSSGSDAQLHGAQDGHDEHDEHDEDQGHAENEAQAAHDEHRAHPDRNISAFMLGLKSRPAALFMQSDINKYEAEPLSAILPGFALLELWEIVGLVENTLLGISAFVVVVGLFTMLIVLMTSVNERRREMAILRAAGAGPGHVFLLILAEAAFITMAGLVLGCLLVSGLIYFAQDWVASEFGLFLAINWLSPRLAFVLLLVASFGCLIGIFPAIRVYRYSLSDGMTVRS